MATIDHLRCLYDEYEHICCLQRDASGETTAGWCTRRSVDEKQLKTKGDARGGPKRRILYIFLSLVASFVNMQLGTTVMIVCIRCVVLKGNKIDPNFTCSVLHLRAVNATSHVA